MPTEEQFCQGLHVTNFSFNAVYIDCFCCGASCFSHVQEMVKYFSESCTKDLFCCWIHFFQPCVIRAIDAN